MLRLVVENWPPPSPGIPASVLDDAYQLELKQAENAKQELVERLLEHDTSTEDVKEASNVAYDFSSYELSLVESACFKDRARVKRFQQMYPTSFARLKGQMMEYMNVGVSQLLEGPDDGVHECRSR